MKTAIIADIHGNFYALEAVLKAIRQENPDEIICAGDMINPLWDSNLVLEVLQSEKITCLRGNHEDYIINYHKKPADWQAYNLKPIKITAENLSQKTVQKLADLPLYHTAGFKDEILICHSSPTNNAKNYSDKTVDEIDLDFNQFSAKIIVNAHLHQPDIKTLSNRVYLTAGSVGLPMSRSLSAEYLIIETKYDKASYVHKSVDYPHNQAVSAFIRNDFLCQGGAISWLLLDELLTADRNMAIFIPYILNKTLKPANDHEWELEVIRFLERKNRWQTIKRYIKKTT
jgi:predicted phosphodiesterase